MKRKNKLNFLVMTTLSASLLCGMVFTRFMNYQMADSANETYLVQFQTNGGSSMPSIRYEVGDDPITIPECVRYHYELLGWYENPSFSGSPVNKDAYIPTSDVTLYAKWDEVTYLYTYYGESTDHFRYSYHQDDVVVVDELPTPPSLIIRGYSCPFEKWLMEHTYDDAPKTITIGEEDVILVAKYDTSNLPPLTHLEEIEPGVYCATAYLDYGIFNDNKTQIGYFSTDITLIKDSTNSHASGVTFRMTPSKQDYSHEASDESYIAAVMSEKNGTLSFSRILDGSYKSLTSVSLTNLPSSWQDKFNQTEELDDLKFNLAVMSWEDRADIYIDNVFAYSYSDQTELSKYSGTSFGVRATITGTLYENFYIRTDPMTINLDTGKGEKLDPISYYGGCVNLPSPKCPNKTIDCWCYDKELTLKIDTRYPEFTDGITIFAKYKYNSYDYLTFDGEFYNTTHETVAVIGESDSLVKTITMDMYIKKGFYGSIGMTINTATYCNNPWTYQSDYLFIGIANNGGLVVAMADSNKVKNGDDLIDLGCTKGKTLSHLPEEWKNKVNDANYGNLINVVLRVVINDDSVKIYIDDEFANELTSGSVTKMKLLVGDGYGVRVSGQQIGNQFTYDFKEEA